ncbi:MAG: DNA adenine methylase [Bacilli bacterium]
MERNILSNPLRYPGSKSKFADYVAAVIEANLLSGCTIYEPYAGSASISFEMLIRGFAGKAILIERDPLIYAFWKCVFERTDEIIERIQHVEVTLDTWCNFQQYRVSERVNDDSLIEFGLAGLFFNRTNYSGILGSGPIGGMSQSSEYKIDCRFNKNRVIDQIRSIAELRSLVEVVFDDALLYLRRNASALARGFSFVYADPPYYTQGKKLYRYWYDESQHAQLAELLLKSRYPWLVSYDPHPVIKNLYSESRIQSIYTDYTVRISKRSEELLISNQIIPPPETNIYAPRVLDV